MNLKACPRCHRKFPGGVMPARCRCGLAFTSDNKDEESPPYYRQGPSSDNKALVSMSTTWAPNGHFDPSDQMHTVKSLANVVVDPLAPACALRGG